MATLVVAALVVAASKVVREQEAYERKCKSTRIPRMQRGEHPKTSE